MKLLVASFCILALVLGISASQEYTKDSLNKTKSSEASQSSTIWQIMGGTIALYLWGLSRKDKSFKDKTSTAPKSFVVGNEDVSVITEPLDKQLWYIHGKAYDLVGFMTRHPGGYRPLLMAQGRDCTELFESYHSLTDKPRQMLHKFHVPAKDQKQYVSMFNWDMSSPSNAFAVELRAAVREHLNKTNGGDVMAPKLHVLACIIWTIFTTWFTYEYYWAGAWWASILVPVMWWLSFIQTFHDASHFSFARNEFVNSLFVYMYPYFTSPTTWDHQHVIGHHIFTNIFKKDPDLNHGIPTIRIHPGFRYRAWMKFQMAWLWVIWLISTFWLSFVYDWTAISTGIYHGILPYAQLSKLRMGLHIFGRAVSIFLVAGIPFTLFPFGQALWWTVSFYSVWGFLFMLITQVNHIVEDCLEAADEKSECWAAHQAKTSHDYSHGSFFWWLISGGLNLQVEHHLFPGVNSNHLTGMVPIVRGLCDKYGIKYNYSESYYEAICKYLRVIDNGSKDISKTKKVA